MQFSDMLSDQPVDVEQQASLFPGPFSEGYS
jgi:hypothetical protein